MHVVSRPTRISFWFILATLILVGWLHLATPMLAALFSYFVLGRLRWISGNKWVPIGLFVVVILAIAYGLATFTNQTLDALPTIAETTIPKMVTWAEERRIELPFTDFQSLKDLAMDTVKQAKYVANVANIAKIVTMQFAF